MRCYDSRICSHAPQWAFPLQVSVCHNAYNLPHSYSTAQVSPLHQKGHNNPSLTWTRGLWYIWACKVADVTLCPTSNRRGPLRLLPLPMGCKPVWNPKRIPQQPPHVGLLRSFSARSFQNNVYPSPLWESNLGVLRLGSLCHNAYNLPHSYMSRRPRPSQR